MRLPELNIHPATSATRIYLDIYIIHIIMFRAQQNVFDDTIGQYPLHLELYPDGDIAKATDEYLTSENWELILVDSLLKPSPSTAEL